MNVVQLVAVALVVASSVALIVQLRKMWTVVGYLHEHSAAHCEQIGELQHHVSTLAHALDAARLSLPPDLMEFAARRVDDD